MVVRTQLRPRRDRTAIIIERCCPLPNAAAAELLLVGGRGERCSGLAAACERGGGRRTRNFYPTR